MENNQELVEKLFLEKIKPYEDRIKHLEELELAKDLEICSLKHAVKDLDNVIEQMKRKDEASKPQQKKLPPNQEPKRDVSEETKKTDNKNFKQGPKQKQNQKTEKQTQPEKQEEHKAAQDNLELVAQHTSEQKQQKQEDIL